MAFSENSVIKISELRDAIYPVGSIYLSINNTNPKTFFGGEWELLPEGYALWTCSSNGGSTISAGLPNIVGQWYTPPYPTNKGGVSFDGAFSTSISQSANGWNDSGSGRTCVQYLKFNASSSNSIYGNSSTVQPPSYKVFAWKRTS